MRCRGFVRWSACAAFGLAACGGGSYGPASDPGPALPVNVYVDAATGNDANPGTESAPFKTITHALLVITYGHDVHVQPGIYDWTNGETFPLVVPPGVRLLGDELVRGDGRPSTVIEGAGYAPFWATSQPHVPVAGAAVVLDQGATVAGFVVRNTLNLSQSVHDCVVIMSRAGATLRRCTVLAGGDYGLWVTGVADACVVLDNRFHDNFYAIAYDPYGPPPGFAGTARFEANVITGNAHGVMLNQTGADFGGGGLDSAGRNTFARNDVVDFRAYPYAGSDSPPHLTYARDCYWDEVPPVRSSDLFCPPGTDIHQPVWPGDFQAEVDITGAQLAGP